MENVLHLCDTVYWLSDECLLSAEPDLDLGGSRALQLGAEVPKCLQTKIKLNFM